MHNGLERSDTACDYQYEPLRWCLGVSTYVPLESRSVHVSSCTINGLDAIDRFFEDTVGTYQLPNL